jgi:hypothetical protein
MGDQMDMFRERKIARMPTSSIGKVVAVVDEETIENMAVLIASIYERTPATADGRDSLNRALLELNAYLGRGGIAKRIGA